METEDPLYPGHSAGDPVGDLRFVQLLSGSYCDRSLSQAAAVCRAGRGRGFGCSAGDGQAESLWAVYREF